jgi:streptogramin lyase
LAAPAAAGAAPTITLFTGGMGGGLSVSSPHTITRGIGDEMWFTESSNPGRVARFTNGANEFTGGLTPGFSANGFPHRIAPGPDGNIWFTQANNPGRLDRITPTGQVTEFTGGVTPNFPANETPSGITAGPDGNVWFTNIGDPGRIIRVTPAGTFTVFTGGVTPGFSANRFPSSIVTGPDGNLWFTESAGGAIGRFNINDNTVTEFTGGVTPGFTAGRSPQWITVGPDGALWFTEAGAPGGIGRITTGGQVTEFTAGVTPGFSPNGSPGGIAAGPDGNLWFVHVANPGRVARITPEGVVTEFTGGVTPGLPANGFPISIAAGYDGQMWFTLYNAPGRIGKITVAPGVATAPAGGVTAESARLAGSVRPNGQITVYDFEYGRTAAYGSETTSLGAGSGVPARNVSAAISGLRPDTLYHYRLIASNESGTSRGVDRTFRTHAQGTPGGGETGGPAITALRLSRGSFRAASGGPSAKAVQRRRVSTGTIISFTLDRAASVSFKVERARAGRRAGRRCAKPTRRNRGARRCTRYVKVAGSFSYAGKAGKSRLRFSGRLSNRRLAPAGYRLVATAFAGDRAGAAKRVGFRIKR